MFPPIEPVLSLTRLNTVFRVQGTVRNSFKTRQLHYYEKTQDLLYRHNCRACKHTFNFLSLSNNLASCLPVNILNAEVVAAGIDRSTNPLAALPGKLWYHCSVCFCDPHLQTFTTKTQMRADCKSSRWDRAVGRSRLEQDLQRTRESKTTSTGVNDLCLHYTSSPPPKLPQCRSNKTDRV